MKILPTARLLALAAFAVFCACDAYAGIVYVSDTSGNDANDGSSWALAKQTIQGGVDATVAGDTVLVTNGTYNTGSRVSPNQILCKSRVVICNAITVKSVNGPSNTMIVGQGPLGENAIRCIWMTNGAVLSGFTLTNGFTTSLGSGFESDDSGGGAWCQSSSVVLTNCILIENSANRYGGGVYQGTINNCTLTRNSAKLGGGAYDCTLNSCALTANSTPYEGYGGGAYVCTLNECTLTGNSGTWGGASGASTLDNCTITSNSASAGGAAYFGTLNNCIMTGNSVSGYGGGAYYATLNNCILIGNYAGNYGGGANTCTLNNCTLTGNTAAYNGGGTYEGSARNTISYANTNNDFFNSGLAACYTNDPQFMDADNGNYRLQATSSNCINKGLNILAPTNSPYDLDGNQRISGGTIDIGAYEFQEGDYFDLYASANAHGSIIPAGMIRTNYGADVSFIIEPDAYYHVQNVLTNGSSAGAVTNLTWHSISAPGTVTVFFAATLAAQGTPHWWLAQWGWTNNFDAAELLDQDGDSLFTWQEYPPNTCPTNSNTDGDQYDDGVEVKAGADPLQDESRTYGAMQAHPASFNLYTSNSVLDLSYGEMMVQMVSNNIQVRLTMQSTDLLDGGGWTNVGTAVEWQCPAELNKSFFRFLGAPVD